MKSKLIYTGFVVLALFTFWSCSNPLKKQHLAKIDSLNIIMDTALAQLKIFDKPEIKARYEAYTKNFDRIKSEFSWDLKDSGWSKVMEYGNMSKALRKCFSKSSELKSQINESKAQLKDLAHDVEAGSIQKEKETEYVITEEEIIKSIALTVIVKTQQVQQLLDKHDSLSPVIIKILNSTPKTKKGKNTFKEAEEDD